MIYAATISSTSLRLRESRIVADLLLRGVSGAAWREAIVEQNVLQVASAIAVTRSSNILRARLQSLGKGVWEMVRDGNRELATQATFAGAVKHSRLLGDFMDLTMREQRRLFAKNLEPRMWTDYIEGCRGRDPEMPIWSESTVNQLRTVIFSMLADATYIKDTRSLILQNVFVVPELVQYLRDKNETYVLRCMEVTG